MQAPNTAGNNGNGCLQSQHRALHRIRTARSVIYTHNRQATHFGSLSPLSPGEQEEKKTNENHQRSDNNSKHQGHVRVSFNGRAPTHYDRAPHDWSWACQCSFWHFLEQYATFRQPLHLLQNASLKHALQHRSSVLTPCGPSNPRSPGRKSPLVMTLTGSTLSMHMSL